MLATVLVACARSILDEGAAATTADASEGDVSSIDTTIDASHDARLIVDSGQADAAPDACANGGCDPCALPPLPALEVAIIDDNIGLSLTTANRWADVATGLGLTPRIVPLEALDDPTMLDGARILIVTVMRNNDAQRSAVRGFLDAGGGVYLQGEFDSANGGNVAFARLVNGLGGMFAWSGAVAGALQPMVVRGCLGTYPNLVPTLSYYWYGQQGTGNADPFLVSSGQAVAFTYCAPTPDRSLLVHTSDRDWVTHIDEHPEGRLLMENILTHLAHPCR